MNTDERSAAVLRALAAQTDLEPEQIRPDYLLRAIPTIESVKVLRAVAQIEVDCQVAVPDDFPLESATVSDLIELVCSQAPAQR